MPSKEEQIPADAYDRYVRVNKVLSESKALLGVNSDAEIIPATKRLIDDTDKLEKEYSKMLMDCIKKYPLKASRKKIRRQHYAKERRTIRLS